jgi:hypothetical protein
VDKFENSSQASIDSDSKSSSRMDTTMATQLSPRSTSSQTATQSIKSVIAAKQKFARSCTAQYRRLIAQGWTSERAFRAISARLQQPQKPASVDRNISTKPIPEDEIDEVELKYVMERTGFSRAMCLHVMALRR